MRRPQFTLKTMLWLMACVQARLELIVGMLLALTAGLCPAQQVTVRSPSDILAEVSETFGIAIVVAEMRFNEGTAASGLTGGPVTADELQRFAPVLASELFLYPVDVVKRSNLKRIVLCTRLSLRGRVVAGVCGTTAIYLNVSASLMPRRYNCVGIHHEFFHQLDSAAGRILTVDSEWSSSNPRGFKYGQHNDGLGDATAGGFSVSPGFLTPYCMTAAEEDMAEVFAHLVVNGSLVERRAKRDAQLEAKIATMKRGLALLYPELDDEFWGAARRLQRPGPDPVISENEPTKEQPPVSETQE